MVIFLISKYIIITRQGLDHHNAQSATRKIKRVEKLSSLSSRLENKSSHQFFYLASKKQKTLRFIFLSLQFLANFRKASVNSVIDCFVDLDVIIILLNAHTLNLWPFS